MRKKLPLATILIILSPLLFAGSPITDIELVRTEARSLGNNRKTSWIEIDKNNDSKIDQSMLLDAKGSKIYEELDYNADGKMDDFCYFANGVLTREEIDTNFDGHIDLWVFLKNGVYVERYERDTDFDGIIDKIKTYGPKR